MYENLCEDIQEFINYDLLSTLHIYSYNGIIYYIIPYCNN